MSDILPVYGWLKEEEDFETLLALPGEEAWRGSVDGLFSMPEEMNRRWLRTEMQYRISSCQGCSLSEVGEVCANIASEGEIFQFSKMAAYIWSQKQSGIKGDRGSTLEGGKRVALSVGFCREELWKYPSSYSTTPPGGDEKSALADAANHTLKEVVRITSYDGIRNFLGAGLGSVWIGRTKDWGGGHSTHLPGYDKAGNIDEHNSWDVTWGDKGWALRSKAHVKAWFQYPDTVVLGGSDMELKDFKPRPVDWSKEHFMQ